MSGSELGLVFTSARSRRMLPINHFLFVYFDKLNTNKTLKRLLPPPPLSGYISDMSSLQVVFFH